MKRNRVALLVVLFALAGLAALYLFFTRKSEPGDEPGDEPSDEPSAAADPWHQFGDSLYRLTPSPMDWFLADEAARELGGHLVAIDSAAEQDWLVETFGHDRLLWIGLTDQEEEGVWRWTSGAALVYTNWHPGEPNDERGLEDYTFMNFGQPGMWNDLGPGSRRWGAHFGVVEISLEE